MLRQISLICCAWLFAACTQLTSAPPCINGVLLNTLCQHLSGAADLSTVAKADAFADHWREAERCVFIARETGLKLPQDIALAYNSTLELAHRNRYYGSAYLRAAMRESRPLAPSETRPAEP